MAAVAIPVALGVVYIGAWALAGLLALVGVVGASELYRLAQRGGVRPIGQAGYVAAAVPPLAAFGLVPDGPGFDHMWFVFGAALWLMATMTFAVRTRAPGERPLAAVSITALGALYAGGMPAFLILIRHPAAPVTPWAGTALVFLPLVVVWACDSLAMAAGSLIGGRKLAPVLSPGKTWAGAIVGSAGAVVLAPLYGRFVLDRVALPLATWQLVLFGLIVSVVGQVGDVAESLLKREVGVKDSGTFFPGHGGVLDRLDSLYWAIPTAALLLTVYGII